MRIASSVRATTAAVLGLASLAPIINAQPVLLRDGFLAFDSEELVSYASAANVSQPGGALQFTVTSGGYDNYFYRDNTTAAQLLFTSPNASATGQLNRFVAAFPAGNSGALVYFLPDNATNATSTAPLSVTLVNDTLTSVKANDSRVGVEGQIHFSSSATFGVTILGSVRTLRDYVEGGGVMHQIFNWTLADASESQVRLHRRWINATQDTGLYPTMDFVLSAKNASGSGALTFDVTPANASDPSSSPLIRVQAPRGGTVDFQVLCNETSLVGLNPSQVFLPANETSDSNPHLKQVLSDLSGPESDKAKQVSFLAYSNKLLAGGWRFLTYFGRDTLITLRLLMPSMTSEAIEAALGAVIERTNATTGELCHEETIGDYASFVNMQDGQPELGSQPWYNYEAVDTNYFLLPTLSHYFLSLPAGGGASRAKAFLSRRASLQNGTLYSQLLDTNVHHVLDSARAFAEEQKASNLVRIKEGLSIGDWRDSNQGLGWGTYPFDVSVALVPAALRSIAALSKAGVLNETYAANASRYADVWEQHAASFFTVNVTSSDANSRLSNFVHQTNLSSSLLYGQGSMNGTGLPANYSASLNNNNGTSFYALSLHDDGTPVQIMHSDLGFVLLYGTNVSRNILEATAGILKPYPTGLLTNIGLLVANPALDSNTMAIMDLDRGAYHGTVSWGFQNALMAAGLARQLALCNSKASNEVDNPIVDGPAGSSTGEPAWCADKTLVNDLTVAQTALWKAVDGASEERFSEVWSWSFSNSTGRFSVEGLNSFSTDGTESDSIQLWSFGFLGLVDPTANATATK